MSFRIEDTISADNDSENANKNDRYQRQRNSAVPPVIKNNSVQNNIGSQTNNGQPVSMQPVKINVNNAGKGLGRGLSALIGETKSGFVQTDESQQMVATHKLKPTRFQPRKDFKPEALKELAESISKNGIIQPLTVRPTAVKGEYEIVAGERRWRAAKSINLPTVPVIIKELEDKDVMEISLIENIQREDLTPLEEAQAYRRLLGEFGYTQDDLSRTVGKSRPHITNLLRLLSLPEEVKNLLQDGTITMGHARALLGSSEPVKMGQKIASEGLSVRQVENLVANDIRKVIGGKRERSRGSKNSRAVGFGDFDFDRLKLEQLLSRKVNAEVKIIGQGRKGEVVISYKTLEQLDVIIQILSVQGQPDDEVA